MLRGRAQAGLKQYRRAQESSEAALRTLPASSDPRLAGELKNFALKLKLKRCSDFPSAGRLEEAQVRDQLGRRGTCLHDALLDYREVLEKGDSMQAEAAQEQVLQAFASYWKKCKNPPAPPPVRPKDRNARQLKTYFRELAVVLEEDCRSKIRQGSQILRGWEDASRGAATDLLKKAAAELEKIPQ